MSDNGVPNKIEVHVNCDISQQTISPQNVKNVEVIARFVKIVSEPDDALQDFEREVREARHICRTM